jgi:endonuclease V-like protein UPF0215 family
MMTLRTGFVSSSNSRAEWRGLRAVGVEDGGFSRKSLRPSSQTALLVCVLLQGPWVLDFRADQILVDGLDASEKLVCMLSGLCFDAVMLAGVSFAGFNLVDPSLVFEEFHKPILVISRTKPDNLAVKSALVRHFDDWRVRWSIFEKLSPIFEVVSLPNEPPLYIEAVGCNVSWATDLIRASASVCRVPEPIRVAKLIARGLTHKC